MRLGPFIKEDMAVWNAGGDARVTRGRGGEASWMVELTILGIAVASVLCLLKPVPTQMYNAVGGPPGTPSSWAPS